MKVAEAKSGEVKKQIFEEQKAKEAERQAIEKQKASSAPQPVEVKQAAKESDGSVWNPNNYFWEEKNYQKWGDERLKGILKDFKHTIFEGSLTIDEVVDFTGSCGVSIRKGKKICSFDYSAKLKWVCSLVDGKGDEVANVKGEFHLPEISNMVWDDEEELEFNVTFTSGDDQRDRLYPILKSEVAQHMRADIEQFMNELKEK